MRSFFDELIVRISAFPTFRSLRHRNYLLFFVGRFVSLTGTALQMAALMWLAYQLSGDQPEWPAWILVAHLLPSVLLGPWGGTLADRWPRRPLLVVTQSLLLVEATILTVLVYVFEPAMWHLLLLAALSGAILAVDLPARLAYLIELVGREDLSNAVALNSLLFNVAQALGPALAGIVLAQFGPELCFLLNAVSYGAVIVVLLLMDSPWTRDPESRNASPSTFRSGFAFVLERRRLTLLFGLTAIVALCGWPVRSLFPDLCSRYLQGGPKEYGWMLSAMGAGALSSAFVIASFARFETGSRGIVFLGLGIVSVVGSMGVLAWSSSLSLSIAACFGVGFGMISFQASSQAITQLRVGDENRGVVMGIWAMAVRGAQLVGFVAVGWVANFWRVPTILLCQATAVFGVALAVFVIESFAKAAATSEEAPD